MKLIFYLFFFFLLGTIDANGQTPPYFNDLKFWYRSDSGIVNSVGNNVEQWIDLSGNGNHATQYTQIRQPQIIQNSINGYPSLIFTDDILITPAINLTNRTEFIVLNRNGNSSAGSYSSILTTTSSPYHQLYTLNGSGTLNSYINTTNTNHNIALINNFQVITRSISSSSVNLFSNFIEYSAGFQTNLLNTQQIEIGGISSNNFFNGNIVEIISYNTVLNASQLESVHLYLKNRYVTNLSFPEDTLKVYGFCDKILKPTQGLNNYLWSNGLNTDSILVSNSGKYSVSAISNFGVQTFDSIYVLFPEINLNDTFYCENDSVKISTGLSNAYNFVWSNGSMDSSIWVKNSGYYFVTVFDTNGCSKVSDSIFVDIDSFASSASLGYSSNVCFGESIGLSPIPVQPIKYLWSTGDTSSTIEIQNSGLYHLSAENHNGCKLFDTILINVVGFTPFANFVSDTVCFGQQTTFLNNSYSNPLDTIHNYMWEFNGLGVSNAENPSFTFNSNGSFNVKLKIITENGCQDSIIKSVLILNKPISNFYLPINECLNSQISLISDNITDPLDSIVSIFWSHLNNQNYNGDSISVNFITQGVNTIKLKISSQFGCLDSVQKNINIINSQPVGNFNLISPINNSNLNLGFNNFVWTTSTNSSIYKVEIDSTPDFQSSLIYASNDTFLNLPIYYPDKYYWRITSKSICGSDLITPTDSFEILTPFNSINTKVWCSADNYLSNNGSNVYQWSDLSGNNNHFIQNNLNNQPLITVNSINQKPSLTFNNDFLSSSNTVQTGPRVEYYILRSFGNSTAGSYQNIISSAGIPYSQFYIPNNSNDIYSYIDPLNINHGAFPISNFKLIKRTISNDSIKLNINSLSAIGSSISSINNNQIITIGSINNSNFFNGQIAEFIINDSTSTDLIHNYLRFKYSPQMNLGSDIYVDYGFCPITIKATEGLSNYLWNTNSNLDSIQINSTGHYYAQADDFFEFSTSDTIFVKYPTIHLADTFFCANDSVELSPNLFGGYSYLWSTGQTDSTIWISNPGQYWVEVFDSLGCSRMSDTITVIEDILPISTSLGPNVNLCVGNPIGLTSGQNLTTSYLWSTGSTNDTITILNSGTYWVQTTSANGCVGIDSIDVNVIGIAPVADFTTQNICLNQPILFTDLSSIAGGAIINQWNWDFDNGASSNQQNPSYQYPNSGFYNVILTVTTNNGCSSSVTKTVSVYDIPAANFLFQNTCINEITQFTDFSTINTGSIVNWNWNFGDPSSGTNNTSALASPIHDFTAFGTYFVNLIVESNIGCFDTITQQVFIKSIPTAEFDYNNLCENETVQFTDLSSTASGTLIFRVWDLGNGNLVTNQNPTTTYNNSQNYDIQLVVGASNGCNDTIRKSIFVNPEPNVNFGYSLTCQDIMVDFSNLSTINSGNNVAFNWNFGGLDSSNFENANYIFTTSGLFDITLKVTSDSGCSNSLTLPVNIFPKPVVSFTTDPEYANPPAEIQFTPSILNYTYYNWDFGDGNSSEEISPLHLYSDTGVYLVKLQVISSNGCENFYFRNLNIYPKRVDLKIVNFWVDKTEENYYKVTAEILNKGTVDVDEMEIRTNYNDGRIYKEKWYGNIKIGELMTYELTNESYIANLTNRIICVDLDKPNNEDDFNPEDNILCKPYNSEEFDVLNIYPNPTSDYIFVPCIFPEEGQVSIQLFSFNGHVLYDDFRVYQKGYYPVYLDMTKWEDGIYIVKVTFNGQSFYRKIQKID